MGGWLGGVGGSRPATHRQVSPEAAVLLHRVAPAGEGVLVHLGLDLERNTETQRRTTQKRSRAAGPERASGVRSMLVPRRQMCDDSGGWSVNACRWRVRACLGVSVT